MQIANLDKETLDIVKAFENKLSTQTGKQLALVVYAESTSQKS